MKTLAMRFAHLSRAFSRGSIGMEWCLACGVGSTNSILKARRRAYGDCIDAIDCNRRARFIAGRHVWFPSLARVLG